MSELHEQLRFLRLKKGITQTRLARELDISPMALSNWERGTREPSIDFLRKIANYYDVSVDYILNLQPDNEDSNIICNTVSNSPNLERVSAYHNAFSHLDNTSTKKYLDKIFLICEMLNEDALKDLLQYTFTLLQNKENLLNDFKKSDK